jgi:hypothetical protein
MVRVRVGVIRDRIMVRVMFRVRVRPAVSFALPLVVNCVVNDFTLLHCVGLPMRFADFD